jgi:NitT/TauT family transport system substrate-binding protein
MKASRTRPCWPLARHCTGAAGAQAQEKFTYMTNWYAQAEHGGFYQAVATGLYKKYGLDVTIKMGGPQVNIMQMMAAGQTDCIMGSSDMQMMGRAATACRSSPWPPASRRTRRC